MSSAFNPIDQINNIDFKLIYALERVSQIYKTLLWQTQVETGLSPIQSQILIFMLFHDDSRISVSAFAVEFSITKATVSDAVKTLVNKKLIQKKQDKLDKRKQNLRLSKTGLELAKKIQGFTSPLEDAMKKFEADDKSKLLSLVIKLLQELNTKSLLSPLRICTSCHYYNIKDNNSYCNLLETFLKDDELRLDCPEHLIK